MARISAIASLGDTDTATKNIGTIILNHHQETFRHLEKESVPVTMHKDALKDGVHHVLYFILVFLKLYKKKNQCCYTAK